MLFGDLFGTVGEGVNLSQYILELLLVGAFLYLILSKFWWKPMQEAKAKESKKSEKKEE